jgi:hypothetical protein
VSENTFNSQEINLQLQPLPAFIDTDGAFKLNTPMLSSFNFDGSIPKADEPVQAINIKPGYLIQIENGGEYFPVVSVEYDEPDIDDTGFVTINYIDDQGVTVSLEYEETDEINSVYEDWEEKSLGSQGWGITAGGNAIFTNVAVRGDLEASTLNVGGANGITYDGTEGIIGASVTILGGLTIGDVGVYLNEEGYLVGEDIVPGLINPNVTSISGGAITTGTVSANRIDVANIITGSLDTSLYGTKSYNIRITDNPSNSNQAHLALTNENGENKAFINYDNISGLQIATSPSFPTPPFRLGSMKTTINFAGGEVSIGGGDPISLYGNITTYGNITVGSGYKYYGDGSGLTNLPAATIPNDLTVTSIKADTFNGQNNIELRQVVISTNSPINPGDYKAGTLWAVI